MHDRAQFADPKYTMSSIIDNELALGPKVVEDANRNGTIAS